MTIEQQIQTLISLGYPIQTATRLVMEAVALIPEGGSEGIPFSPNALDFTLTPTHYNVRFAASKLARLLTKRPLTPCVLPNCCGSRLKRNPSGLRAMATSRSSSFGRSASASCAPNSEAMPCVVQARLSGSA